ncbi:MAG: hypothetical protein KDB90_05245 [Planctomycetes bacterium]|nr:hypothetical protein [Planctomycetota bacterium]
MNTTQVGARRGAVAASLLLGALLLTGCGGSLRVTTAEVDDAAAIAGQSAFHVKPVSYDFQRDPEWEIPDSDWPTKTSEWSNAFAGECTNADKTVYTLGPGAEASEGAIVEFTVTDMNLGTYAYFYKSPGRVHGVLTITEAKSGQVIFKGSVDSPGTTDGYDRFSYEGRIKVAHLRVARDVEWLINRKLD